MYVSVAFEARSLKKKRYFKLFSSIQKLEEKKQIKLTEWQNALINRKRAFVELIYIIYLDRLFSNFISIGSVFTQVSFITRKNRTATV